MSKKSESASVARWQQLDGHANAGWHLQLRLWSADYPLLSETATENGKGAIAAAVVKAAGQRPEVVRYRELLAEHQRQTTAEFEARQALAQASRHRAEVETGPADGMAERLVEARQVEADRRREHDTAAERARALVELLIPARAAAQRAIRTVVSHEMAEGMARLTLAHQAALAELVEVAAEPLTRLGMVSVAREQLQSASAVEAASVRDLLGAEPKEVGEHRKRCAS